MIGSALSRTIRLLILLALTPLLAQVARAAQATPVSTPSIAILNETPGNVAVSMLVRNVGPNDDVLLAASSPLAERVEVHLSRLETGVRVMKLASDGVVLPSGSMVILEPEASHLMLIRTREPLAQGDLFYLVLRFQHAGDVPVTGRVRRKLDAAGVPPIPPVTVGGIEISLVSAPPAPAAQG